MLSLGATLLHHLKHTMLLLSERAANGSKVKSFSAFHCNTMLHHRIYYCCTGVFFQVEFFSWTRAPPQSHKQQIWQCASQLGSSARCDLPLQSRRVAAQSFVLSQTDTSENIKKKMTVLKEELFPSEAVFLGHSWDK